LGRTNHTPGPCYSFVAIAPVRCRNPSPGSPHVVRAHNTPKPLIAGKRFLAALDRGLARYSANVREGEFSEVRIAPAQLLWQCAMV
jgi:hypothetical protein